MESHTRNKPHRRPRLPRGRNRTTRTSTSSATTIATGKSSSSTTTTPPGSDLTGPLQILQAVWVRHRNQHHTQPWWKTLGLLRKWVARLVELEERERELTTAAHGTRLPTSNQRKKGAAMDGKEPKGSSGDSAAASEASTMSQRARRNFEEQAALRTQKEAVTAWLRDTICPRCYVGFSSVVVESQFANLGVVLMAVLADVVAVVGQPREVTASKARGHDNDPVATSITLTARSVRITGTAAGSVVDRVYDSDDVGEVIERRPDKKRKTSEVDDGDDQEHGNEAGGSSSKQVPSSRVNDAQRRGLSSEASHAPPSRTPGPRELPSKTTAQETRKPPPGRRLGLATTSTASVAPTRRPMLPEHKDSQESGDLDQENPAETVPEPESPSTTRPIMVAGQANPVTLRKSKTQTPKSTDIAETSERKKREGEKKATKGKKKKKNAIDDLFAGFE
ncbi:hypothetical protein PV10_05521 [Exophiala mesophila]|uniref:RNase MRP protein 1 RNA binding domain-containing protein n=1 Tax=Exophiala mesophila TaxID=212818 RepID=A0A0D1ZAC3_EXOME|nr:uncharacterized protein PV10_05521 [Exophiala mesophila]KIV90919.1 hypothetical protein PV10_05521 [Exophiala mesophila]